MLPLLCGVHRVARDLSGSKFWWTYPYVHDDTTKHAAMKGAALLVQAAGKAAVGVTRQKA